MFSNKKTIHLIRIFIFSKNNQFKLKLAFKRHLFSFSFANLYMISIITYIIDNSERYIVCYHLIVKKIDTKRTHKMNI